MNSSLRYDTMLNLLIGLICLIHAACANDVDFAISGYFPEYRSYINLNRTAPYLTDIILFSLTPDAAGNLGKCCLEAHHFQQARTAQAAVAFEETSRLNKLKLWVSVGGAGRSNAFPQIAADPKRRTQLVSSLITLCQREGLDGVDFDWEAPQNQKESENYVTLLTESSKAFHQVGILVSVALHPHQLFPKHMFDAVDRVHLMTYDMVTRGAHHALLGKMKNAVQALLDGGCPSRKVVVGIPAYARHGQNPGLVKTFSECFDEMESTTAREVNKGVWNNYYYDSPKLIRHKVTWAEKQGLAGVFFWELGQDKQHETLGPGGILVQAAYKQKMKIIHSSEDSIKLTEEL